ncbi:unnamed protein product [Trifolium pratense]|uniref:Uncharacterized protein n=1 Tax=Trifolium pratense TaxID=57577 RepID=A0ACB0JT68_TRIPR|nr:unnamed protein product [Trifolium pratense]
MEPSQDIEYSEGEFSGTESGWTTYIGSPMIHSEIYNDEEPSVNMDDYGNNFKNTHKKIHDDVDVKVEKSYDNEESDNDSMASDASSGPSHFQLLCIKSERSNDLHENDHRRSSQQREQPKRRSKTTKYAGGLLVAKEEETLLVADSASSHV